MANNNDFSRVLFLCVSGLQRIHNARYEPAPRTVPHPTYYTQGNRAHGSNNTQEVFLNTNAA